MPEATGREQSSHIDWRKRLEGTPLHQDLAKIEKAIAEFERDAEDAAATRMLAFIPKEGQIRFARKTGVQWAKHYKAREQAIAEEGPFSEDTEQSHYEALGALFEPCLSRAYRDVLMPELVEAALAELKRRFQIPTLDFSDN